MTRKTLLVVLVALTSMCLPAQQSRPANDWKDFDFVLGD